MIRTKALVATAALFAFAASSASAQDKDLKVVWGGGPPEASAYSGTYVPHVINLLDEVRLAGYHWGGVSQGTVENAEKVTANPTHLAVGQLDILQMIQGQPIPGQPGATYQFTFVQQEMGPECLYLVTAEKNYETFGHVLANSWDLTVVTGGEKSGSYGTWQVLQNTYPDLVDAPVVNVGNNDAIIEAVKTTPGTFGFFVMRPDPASAIFKSINDAGLALVPVVDFELEGKYTFKTLKVAHGLFSGGQYHTTACTSVALITGDQQNPLLTVSAEQRRLEETINRLQNLAQSRFQPDTSSWRDMWDSVVAVAEDQAKILMQQSKDAFDHLTKSQAG